MGDSLFFEHLLNDEPIVSLLHAVQPMDGLSFWHGKTQQQKTFDFDRHGAPDVRYCLAWAENKCCLEDAKRNLTLDQLAAIHA